MNGVFRSIFFVYFLVLATATVCLGDDPKQDTKRLAHFLLNGYKASRNSLNIGVFHAQGRKIHNLGDGEEREFEIEIFSAFNNSKALFRFDQFETIKPAKGDPLEPSRREGGKFARTPTRSLIWHGNGRTVIVERSDENLPPWLHPFDARCAGLLNLGSLSSEADFNSTYEYLEKSTYVEAVEEKPGLYRLSWHSPDATTHTNLWLDEKKGFSPTRMEVRYLETTDGKVSRGALVEVSETTYIDISGVWVPRSFRIQEGNPKARGLQICELTFDWEAVNQAIDEKAFSIEGFDMPRGSVVIDGRLAKPIILGLTGDVPFPSPKDDKDIPVPSSVGWPTTIIGLVFVLIASTGLWYAYGRWCRARPAAK